MSSIGRVDSMSQSLSLRVESGNGDNYELIRRLGNGRYGQVFEAMDVMTNAKCAVKVLKPVAVSKVIREINILRRLYSGPNVIELKDIIVNNGIPSLVFPFVSDQTLKTLAMDLSGDEVRLYLCQLLRAISFVHKNAIFHRDVKPTNVLIDRRRKVLRLIDFGLAEDYVSDKAYTVTVASRFYKSPELLLNNTKYDYSLDIWSFGAIVAALLFRKEPFFSGIDNTDQLRAICAVMGTKCLKVYVRKYRLKKSPQIEHLFDCNLKARQWKHFIVSGFETLANDISIDFLDKLLVFDHKLRLTAEEALRHPFFDSICDNRNVSNNSTKF